jgi:hypothetical protein
MKKEKQFWEDYDPNTPVDDGDEINKISLWDYYKSITSEKVVIDLNDKDVVKKFPYFVIVKFLSQNQSDIHLANEINYRPHMDNRLKMDFFINTLRKKYRKANKFMHGIPDDIQLIMDFYDYSESKAKQVRNLFDDNQLNRLRRLTNKGGINGEFNR